MNLPVYFFFAVAILTASVTSASNELYVVEAGNNGLRGPRLVNGLTFCPAEFSARGFSILCSPPHIHASAPAGARGISFIVNGTVVKVEWNLPYALNGDAYGVIFPWNNYQPGRTSIGCFRNNAGGSLITVNFKCPHSAAPGTPSPSPVSTPAPAFRRRSSYHDYARKSSQFPSPSPTFAVPTKTPEPSSVRTTPSRAARSSSSPSIKPTHRIPPSSSPCTSTASSSSAASNVAPTATRTPTATSSPPPSHPSLVNVKSGNDSPSYLPFSFPHLGIVKPRQSGKDTLFLRDGFTFCPSSFGQFTIICENHRATSVTFEVNGRTLRTDTAAPFTVNEEVNGEVAAWNSYPMGRITITAVTNTGMRADVNGRFDCPTLKRKPDESSRNSWT